MLRLSFFEYTCNDETLIKQSKYPQLVLLTAFIILLFNSGMRFSLGLLLVPMADSLEWSRTTLSSMMTLFMLVTATALPFTGQLVDRLGPFRVLSTGVLLAGIALALTSLVQQPWQAWLFYGVLFALGSAATSITPIGVILSRAFPDRAGLANSIAISGMGVGQLLIISVLAAFLVQTGWRGAFLWMGLGSMVAILPWLYLVKRMQPAPVESESSAAVQQQAAPSLSLTAAMCQRRMWLLLVIYAICGFQDFFIATHIVALAIDSNVDSAVAGQMLAFMGLAGLVGVLLSGIIADRYGPRSVTLLCFILRIGLFIVMLLNRDPVVIIVAALTFGFTFWMTAPMTVLFARQLVGLSLLGTVTGIITMVHHGMGGMGAVFGAIGFDTSGSYDSGLMSMLALSVLGGVLTLLYRESSRDR